MKFASLLRRIVPRKAVTAARFISVFNRGFGHGRTRKGLCLDGDGLPIPWITYPCLEYLRTLDFRGCAVFEYGSGSSTLWWAARARTVTSVEREADWFQRVQPDLPANAQVALCSDETRYADHILATDQAYDVIVIDGAVRYPCAQAMLARLKPAGLVILDNTEWYPNLSRLLREDGFCQVDFSGFGPINAFASCTSIFFKDPVALSRRLLPARWAPVGGRFLEAHDDRPLAQMDPATLQRG